MAKSMTADEFFTGLFAALALKGSRSFSLRSSRFDQAVADAYGELLSRAADAGVDVRFRVLLHPRYGDSATIRNSITRAAQRDLVSLRNPEYQEIDLKLDAANAEFFLEGLPAEPDLYKALADRFITSYRG